MLRIIPQSVHKIAKEQLDIQAISIAETLSKAGFETYLVGGCIRDLLLGKAPKDFDIATSAHPEQVKSQFKRCRLIGRRFRLAHVRNGKEVIEVATFRANPAKQPLNSKDTRQGADPNEADGHQVSENGLLIRDNCYGSVEEDVMRRDLTINALYLNVTTMDIHDYINAIPDINAHAIRVIGDPEIRFREDPVRTLRVIRFKAKLKGFRVNDATQNALQRALPLLSEVSPARRFEELLKFFLTGHAQSSFQHLIDFNALHYLLPVTAKYLETANSKALYDQALINTDDRIAINKHVTPAFLMAVFLWPTIRELKIGYMNKQNIPSFIALQKAVTEIIEKQNLVTSIPKRFALAMREIWELQERLPSCSLKRCEAIVQQRRFRAGYDFLLLREECGEIKPGLGDWWTEYQVATIRKKKELISTRQKNKRKQRVEKK